MSKKWYVIHTQTGKEEGVKKSIENHMKQDPESAKFVHKIFIPTEKVSEVRGGEKKISERKFFPGYILVEMELNDKSWYLIKNTPGVTGFVGSGNKPVPLQKDEVNQILKQMESETPRIKVGFKQGQSVRVTDGPFAEFVGIVDEISADKGKVKVLLSLFGRETPVELDFLQIEKL